MATAVSTSSGESHSGSETALGSPQDRSVRRLRHYPPRHLLSQKTLVSLAAAAALVLVAVAFGPARSAAEAGVHAVVEKGARPPSEPVFQMGYTLDGSTLQCTGNAGDCGGIKL